MAKLESGESQHILKPLIICQGQSNEMFTPLAPTHISFQMPFSPFTREIIRKILLCVMS
jgi:hypothetical protein